MAQPQAYNRETDFTERDGDDTNHPGINTELDAAAQSINEIRDNLALIQRDDGALQNGIVTAESLAPSAFDAVLVQVNLAVTDAQTAATSANNAAVSANTARDQAVAAKDAAETANISSALNAATASAKAAEANASATAAQASATASGNSATASQTSRLASEAARDASQAAQAAASASQTATATSEANANASAATAAAQAGIATTQAGIATTQATNAAASATAAAASLDSFDDRYLGSKTADPTTDNDGNALLTGALYFNSAAGEMRVYTGTAWKATGSAVNGTTNRAKYTATAGQTTFAMTYDVGFVDVYLNGLKLESGVEFTANNGTSVILATGATAGDVVDMIAFGIFSVANTYTKAEADALLGAKAPQATTYTKTEVDAALAGKQASLGYTPVNKAGDTITGDFGLGISPTAKLHVYSSNAVAKFEGSSTALAAYQNFYNGGGDKAYVGIESSLGNGIIGSGSAYAMVIATASTNPLVLGTNGVRRAQINSGGQLFTTIDGTSSVMADYGCRAWVNFNGIGTIAIRGSGNVSSITDLGVGTFAVNLATGMPDVNYSVVANCSNNGSGWSSPVLIHSAGYGSVAPTTTQFRLQSAQSGFGAMQDNEYYNVALFR